MLTLNGSAVTYNAEPLLLNGTGTATNGALRNVSTDNIWTGPITLGSATRIQSDANTLTINARQAIVSAGYGLTLGGAGNIAVTGQVILGSGGLTKTNAGSVTLSGVNDWTGTTTLDAGYLVLSRPESLGGTERNVTVNSTAALVLNYSSLALGTAQPLLNNRVVASSAGAVLFSDGSASAGDSFDFNAAGLTTAYFGGYSTAAAGTNAIFTGTLTPAGSPATYRLSTLQPWVLANTNALTGAIPVAVGDTGTSTVYVALTNNYTGATTLQKGMLSVAFLADGDAPSGIGSSSSAAANLVLNGGGLQYIGAVNTSTNRGYQLLGNSTLDASGKGSMSISGDMDTTLQTVNAALTLQGTGVGTLSGLITENAGAFAKTNISKVGTGTWILSNALNAFTGGITVGGGVLQIKNTGAIGTAGTVTVNAGGTLALDFTPVIAGFVTNKIVNTSAGTIALTSTSADQAINFSTFTAASLGAVGNVNYTGTFTPNGTTYRLGGGGGTLTYNTLITGGNAVTIGAGLNPDVNAGTVVLGGANTFTGKVTIASGTLSAATIKASAAAPAAWRPHDHGQRHDRPRLRHFRRHTLVHRGNAVDQPCH